MSPDLNIIAEQLLVGPFMVDSIEIDREEMVNKDATGVVCYTRTGPTTVTIKVRPLEGPE